MSQDYFMLRCGDRHEKIPYNELQYLEVMDDHILLHFPDKRLATTETLEWIMSRLPQDAFLPVHHWFVVAFRHITKVGDDYVMVADTKIPLNREGRAKLTAVMMQGQLSEEDYQ
ncbi:LytTR family DNA-binding domain-containing protein [Chitinophaga qingshengii]|uniref:LytTR family transcriptional regulator n=1 Tax=Chitinophaga qingshengii TaxID=1569794 RepID=A0ABR7TWE0_9BACT|nr:LytTR family DNA-binding domain-containing protein [Chitinophaga qingshengii]MBC9934807.1 LytTR family transcriptional regulator [Chitinophaga qingshengii]